MQLQEWNTNTRKQIICSEDSSESLRRGLNIPHQWHATPLCLEQKAAAGRKNPNAILCPHTESHFEFNFPFPTPRSTCHFGSQLRRGRSLWSAADGCRRAACLCRLRAFLGRSILPLLVRPSLPVGGSASESSCSSAISSTQMERFAAEAELSAPPTPACPDAPAVQARTWQLACLAVMPACGLLTRPGGHLPFLDFRVPGSVPASPAVACV